MPYEGVMRYCDKCGKIWDMNLYDDSLCDICKNSLKIVPDKYLDKELLEENVKDLDYSMEGELIEELVKTSPNFDQWYFDHKDEIKSEQDRKYHAAMEHGKAILNGTDKGNSYGIKCPYCNATNVQKIGFLSRSLSTGLFGIGSGKIGKQWHCTHCGSDF